MLRLAVIAAVAGAAIAASAPALAADAATPVVTAKLAACHVSTDRAGRYAVFSGSVTALPGTKRMWMRFDLQDRIPPSTAFSSVTVPKWGKWEKSRARVPAFVFTRRVDGLAAPGAYRAVLRFRWYDAKGRLQHRARKVTAACNEPDLRPDLTGALLGAVAGPLLGEATYAVRVRNRGRGPAGAFDVVLAADGTPQPPQRLAGLPAGAQQELTVVGPACRPGTVVRLTFDTASEVTESNEANNTVDATCPLPAAARRR